MTLLSQGPCLREKDGYHTEKQEQVPFFSLLPVPTVACHEDSCSRRKPFPSTHDYRTPKIVFMFDKTGENQPYLPWTLVRRGVY